MKKYMIKLLMKTTLITLCVVSTSLANVENDADKTGIIVPGGMIENHKWHMATSETEITSQYLTALAIGGFKRIFNDALVFTNLDSQQGGTLKQVEETFDVVFNNALLNVTSPATDSYVSGVTKHRVIDWNNRGKLQLDDTIYNELLSTSYKEYDGVLRDDVDGSWKNWFAVNTKDGYKEYTLLGQDGFIYVKESGRELKNPALSFFVSKVDKEKEKTRGYNCGATCSKKHKVYKSEYLISPLAGVYLAMDKVGVNLIGPSKSCQSLEKAKIMSIMTAQEKEVEINKRISEEVNRLQAEKTRIESLKGGAEENNRVYASRLQQEMDKIRLHNKAYKYCYNDKSGGIDPNKCNKLSDNIKDLNVIFDDNGHSGITVATFNSGDYDHDYACFDKCGSSWTPHTECFRFSKKEVENSDQYKYYATEELQKIAAANLKKLGLTKSESLEIPIIDEVAIKAKITNEVEKEIAQAEEKAKGISNKEYDEKMQKCKDLPKKAQKRFMELVKEVIFLIYNRDHMGEGYYIEGMSAKLKELQEIVDEHSRKNIVKDATDTLNLERIHLETSGAIRYGHDVQEATSEYASDISISSEDALALYNLIWEKGVKAELHKTKDRSEREDKFLDALLDIAEDQDVQSMLKGFESKGVRPRSAQNRFVDNLLDKYLRVDTKVNEGKIRSEYVDKLSDAFSVGRILLEGEGTAEYDIKARQEKRNKEMEFRKKENQNRGAGDSVLSTVVDVKEEVKTEL